MTTHFDVWVPIFEPFGSEIIGSAHIMEEPRDIVADTSAYGIFEKFIFTEYHETIAEFWGELKFSIEWGEELPRVPVTVQTSPALPSTAYVDARETIYDARDRVQKRKNDQRNGVRTYMASKGFNYDETTGRYEKQPSENSARYRNTGYDMPRRQSTEEFMADLEKRWTERLEKMADLMSECVKEALDIRVDELFEDFKSGIRGESGIPEGFVDVDYIMDPQKENIRQGDQLKNGDIVLIEDRLMRERLIVDAKDKDDIYRRTRRRETSRWCRVTNLRFNNNIMKFEAIYSDGSHLTRTYSSDYTWYVKK